MVKQSPKQAIKPISLVVISLMWTALTTQPDWRHLNNTWSQKAMGTVIRSSILRIIRLVLVAFRMTGEHCTCERQQQHCQSTQTLELLYQPLGSGMSARGSSSSSSSLPTLSTIESIGLSACSAAISLSRPKRNVRLYATFTYDLHSIYTKYCSVDSQYTLGCIYTIAVHLFTTILCESADASDVPDAIGLQLVFRRVATLFPRCPETPF